MLVPASRSAWSPAGDLPPELRESVHFSATGVEIDAALAIDSWSALISHLGTIEAGVPWWIGDALVFGDHAYGSKYADAVESTGLRLQTLKNYAWVARSVPPKNRDAALPWRLHREIARLDPRQQRAWLKRAKAGGWATDDLRRELVAAKHREEETPEFDAVTEDEQGQLDEMTTEGQTDRKQTKCPKCGHRFEP